MEASRARRALRARFLEGAVFVRGGGRWRWEEEEEGGRGGSEEWRARVKAMVDWREEDEEDEEDE